MAISFAVMNNGVIFVCFLFNLDIFLPLDLLTLAKTLGLGLREVMKSSQCYHGLDHRGKLLFYC